MPQEDTTVHRVPVRPSPSAPTDYEVLVGGGLRRTLPELLARACPAHRYALLTDDRVGALHGEELLAILRGAGLRVDALSIPAGEASKTRERWAELSDRMLDLGMGRDAAVLALGGGVVGDLAGFVAATYLRGLPLVQLPTSLLAMIDSSVGGKTGVDTRAGKNLIGAFLQPRAVAADTDLLRTLPPEEVRSGLAEAIKHGAIADPEYFAWIDGALPGILGFDPAALDRLVARSVEIKAEVVGRDERESGPRKTLNFGHTVGHAVEALSGFRLLHGECVAIGMVVEARLGEGLGVTAPGAAERIAAVLERAGLPTRVPPEYEPAAVVAATRSDKKARGGRVEYALLRELGACDPGEGERWSRAVDDARVIAAIAGG